MAKWENFADFGVAQEANFYYYLPRVKPEFQPGQDCCYGVWCEQPWGCCPPSRHSYSWTLAGNGPRPLMDEVAGHPAGTSVTPQETKSKTKFAAEGGDEHAPEDPSLPLNVEELNKEFMAQSEELYDSLLACHWQPLDCSGTPEQTPERTGC